MRPIRLLHSVAGEAWYSVDIHRISVLVGSAILSDSEIPSDLQDFLQNLFFFCGANNKHIHNRRIKGGGNIASRIQAFK